MGDADFEHVKRSQKKRRDELAEDQQMADTNPIIINASINIGNGMCLNVPIRKRQDLKLTAHNICKIHNLNMDSRNYLHTVLEQNRQKASEEMSHEDYSPEQSYLLSPFG